MYVSCFLQNIHNEYKFRNYNYEILLHTYGYRSSSSGDSGTITVAMGIKNDLYDTITPVLSCSPYSRLNDNVYILSTRDAIRRMKITIVDKAFTTHDTVALAYHRLGTNS